jgi:hypothetical protein
MELQLQLSNADSDQISSALQDLRKLFNELRIHVSFVDRKSEPGRPLRLNEISIVFSSNQITDLAKALVDWWQRIESKGSIANQSLRLTFINQDGKQLLLQKESSINAASLVRFIDCGHDGGPK